jgi:hypothetical protein
MTDSAVPRQRKTRNNRFVARRDLPAIVLSAGLAITLLALGVPRSVAAWASLAADPPIEKLQTAKTPTDAELAEGIAGLQRALAWVPSARRMTDLALLEAEQALRLSGEDPKRAEAFARAERHLVDGLMANPADAFAWVRLAFVREQLGAPDRKIAEALAQSLDVGPNIRSLWIPRATMFLTYWRYLTVDELPAMRAQLRTIWTANEAMRLELLQAVVRTEQVPLITWALEDDATAQEGFEMLKANPPKPTVH